MNRLRAEAWVLPILEVFCRCSVLDKYIFSVTHLCVKWERVPVGKKGGNYSKT